MGGGVYPLGLRGSASIATRAGAGFGLAGVPAARDRSGGLGAVNAALAACLRRVPADAAGPVGG